MIYNYELDIAAVSNTHVNAVTVPTIEAATQQTHTGNHFSTSITLDNSLGISSVDEEQLGSFDSLYQRIYTALFEE